MRAQVAPSGECIRG